ncbi:MAG TPA: hypothetical protein VID48_09340 [Solirubrobacteraceae bacterium]|jgi:uncharacterized membrane protein
MSPAELTLALSVFLACAVEAVEALTIVLAVGTTRGWSSALRGVAAAALALAVIVAALGPALTSLPIGVLRVAVGGLLLIFGLQWLRKAILRAAGAKAKHDELAIYAREASAAEGATAVGDGFDSYAFAIAFKGVLLEGLEVAFIVLTFGANQHRIGLAAIAAAAAGLSVLALGIAVRAPLARVPENTMKFAVGVMLCSFGMFWSAEGAGAHWPGGDVALLVIAPALALGAFALIGVARAAPPILGRAPSPRSAPPVIGGPLRALVGFFVGDDWRAALGVGTALSLTALVAGAGVSAWWLTPLAVFGLLALVIARPL